MIVFESNQEIFLSLEEHAIFEHLKCASLVIVYDLGTPVEVLGDPHYNISLSHDHSLFRIIAHDLSVESNQVQEDCLSMQSSGVNEKGFITF